VIAENDKDAQTAVIARRGERLKSTLSERLYSNAKKRFQLSFMLLAASITPIPKHTQL
jgi:hypothetical protein